MRHLIAAALLIPLTASADALASPDDPVDAETAADAPVESPAETPDESPGDAGGFVTAPTTNVAPSGIGTTTTTTTTTADGATTTTTTTTFGGPGIAPAAPGAAAPMADDDPCSVHGKWRQRMKGRLSLGFSKSHIRLGDHDDEGQEGHQKSFVVRLNGRSGWSLEFELAKLKLDGGDTAKTGGISVVKTFGKRMFAPYVLAGGGGGRYEFADGTEQKIHFAEIGGGIMLRKSRFSIGVDVRRGVRRFKESGDEMIERGMTTPGVDGGDDHDHYTRGRVLALINF